MSNLAHSQNFVPRESLNRVIEYRPHLKWSYYSLLVTASILALPAFALILLKGLSIFSLGVAAVCLLPSIALFLHARFMLRPLAFSVLTVKSDSVEIDLFGKKNLIPFAEVKSVSFKFIGNVGGWFSLNLENGKSHRFTVVLERSEYILEALANFQPDLIPSERMLNYRRTAIIADHSWARLYDLPKHWKSFLLNYVGFPLVAGAVLLVAQALRPGGLTASPLHQSFSLMSTAAVMHICIGFACWVAKDIYLLMEDRKRLLADPNAVVRNQALDLTVNRLARLANLALTSIALVVYFVVALL